MSEIYVASEVDAGVDLGDIVVKTRGLIRMRLTFTAAEALANRLREAVEKGKAMGPAPKKEIVPPRRNKRGD